jgi:hypothetical protein
MTDERAFSDTIATGDAKGLRTRKKREEIFPSPFSFSFFTALI